MAELVWILFLLAMTLPDLTLGTENNTTSGKKDSRIIDKPRCATRMESVLELMRRDGPNVELAGYSLHQQLRAGPYEMYVTDMRVRGLARFRVERCNFQLTNTSLDARLLFDDLTVSGGVKLYEASQDPLPNLAETCNMTIRLRRAPLQLTMSPAVPNTIPRSPEDVRTYSKFIGTDFLNFYGCRPVMQHRGMETPELAREMEQMFLRGIRSLLEAYMERQLHTAMMETMMSFMGYTVSYGRR